MAITILHDYSVSVGVLKRQLPYASTSLDILMLRVSPRVVCSMTEKIVRHGI